MRLMKMVRVLVIAGACGALVWAAAAPAAALHEGERHAEKKWKEGPRSWFGGTAEENADAGASEVTAEDVASDPAPSDVEPQSHYQCAVDADLPEPVVGTALHEIDAAQQTIESGVGESLPANVAQTIGSQIGCFRQSPTDDFTPFQPGEGSRSNDDTDPQVLPQAVESSFDEMALTGPALPTGMLAVLFAGAGTLVLRRSLLP